VSPPNQSPSAPECDFFFDGGIVVTVIRKHPWIEVIALLIGVAIFTFVAVH